MIVNAKFLLEHNQFLLQSLFLWKATLILWELLPNQLLSMDLKFMSTAKCLAAIKEKGKIKITMNKLHYPYTIQMIMVLHFLK